MTRLLLIVVIVANIATAIAVVYARHQHRVLFVQLNQLDKARDELNIEFGRLQLEQATVGESNRVERIARERLGMKSPNRPMSW